MLDASLFNIAELNYISHLLEQAYYRRADALYALGRIKQAFADFKRAAKVAPKSADVRQKLQECEKEIKRLRFEEALDTPVNFSKLLLHGHIQNWKVALFAFRQA